MEEGDVLLQVLERACTEAHPVTVVAGAETGQARTDDSCAV